MARVDVSATSDSRSSVKSWNATQVGKSSKALQVANDAEAAVSLSTPLEDQVDGRSFLVVRLSTIW